ncbi:MAG: polymer-forming cytoskeletal protein [Rhodospirillales bacterium]|nr:polymer-forming cytoskeletal protein [Rhodospirillales bacterium]
MFSKNNKKAVPENKPAPVPAPPSIISRDLSIVGDLLSDGEIQIDGKVNGDIRTRTLIVGESAKVRGEIVSETCHVLGRVDGQIKAKVVKLAATAHVVGDILHEDLSIETGAFLEGHCKRMVIPEDVHKAGKESAIEATQKAKPQPNLKPAPATAK